MHRTDDFDQRRAHLKDLSDDELRDRFWKLAQQVVTPLIAQARTHTSPSIERSVLLRMGFSSLEAKALVEQMGRRGLLGYGAGALLLKLAQREGMAVREAGLGLLEGLYWECLAGNGSQQ
jgi:D-ornithine 4,5-aminomutase subunit alpha